MLGTTAWESVAVGATEDATPVAPEVGVTLSTVGGVAAAVCEYTTSTQ